MKATRGSCPMRRANAAERMAIAASCSAVGRSVTAVSAISTVWLRADDDVDAERRRAVFVVDHRCAPGAATG